MDKKNIFVKNGVNVFRIVGAHNKKASVDFIDEDYYLDIEWGRIWETGLLKIFSILNKTNKKDPFFIWRWDEKEYLLGAQQTLDIDIRNVNFHTSKLFKSWKDDYSGHHPKKISDDPRSFDINISLPGKVIFRGRISFNIEHGHSPHLFSNATKR